MRWISALTLVVGAAILWMVCRDVDTPVSGPLPRVVDFSDSASWVGDLQKGAEVVFRQDAAESPGSGAEATLTGLGRLAAAEEVRLHEGFLVADASQALAEAQTKAESGKAKHYQAFLRERYLLSKVVAVNEMIDSGEYVVLEADAAFPPIPHDYGVMAIPQFVLGDGSVRDVWFLIDLQKHEAVRQALEAAEEFEAHRLDERVIAFNTKPMEERRTLIEQHDTATRAVRNWPAERPPKEAIEFRKQMLPLDFALDRNNWLVSKRLRRNH